MSEQVYIYSLENKNIVQPMDRDKFYEEQIKNFQETGRVNKAVEVIAIFLFNTDGEILIQKRGKHKKHNASLLDKSLGGHIKYGDTADFTTMVETVEELHTPSIVLRDPTDFEKTRILLKNYRQNIAIMKLFKTDFFELAKKIGDDMVPIVNKVHIYVGVYDGSVRPSDKEASGVMWYSIDDLVEDIQKNPDAFTEELKIYMKIFKDDFVDFAKYVEE